MIVEILNVLSFLYFSNLDFYRIRITDLCIVCLIFNPLSFIELKILKVPFKTGREMRINYSLVSMHYANVVI